VGEGEASTGKILVVIMVMNSMTGGAGVYSNWLLTHHDLTVGFWHKSMYLYAFGALLNVASGYVQNEESFGLGHCLYEWFYVYDMNVWVIVITNVTGGLLVGMLLRQLGVLSQNIASCSIMFATAALQWVIMYTPPTTETMLGAALCATAVSIYNDDVWALIRAQFSGECLDQLDAAVAMESSPPASPLLGGGATVPSKVI